MNKTSLKRLAAMAAVLFALVFTGCAHMGSTDTMGESMDTMGNEKTTDMGSPAMSGTMETGDDAMMNKSMDTMDAPKMETQSDMMQENGMMEPAGKKMESEPDKMMK